MYEEEIINKENELRELCLNCKHTKRFHKNGSCSQPTCMCNCFIKSGLIYTTDVLNAFEQGKQDAQKIFNEKIKLAKQCLNFKLIHCDNKYCKNEYCPLWEELKDGSSDNSSPSDLQSESEGAEPSESITVEDLK